MSLRTAPPKLAAIAGTCFLAATFAVVAVRTARAYIVSPATPKTPSDATADEDPFLEFIKAIKGEDGAMMREAQWESPTGALDDQGEDGRGVQGGQTSGEDEVRFQDARTGHSFDPSVTTRGRPVLAGDGSSISGQCTFQ